MVSITTRKIKLPRKSSPENDEITCFLFIIPPQPIAQKSLRNFPYRPGLFPSKKVGVLTSYALFTYLLFGMSGRKLYNRNARCVHMRAPLDGSITWKKWDPSESNHDAIQIVKDDKYLAIAQGRFYPTFRRRAKQC